MSEPRPADSVLMGDAAHVDVHAPQGTRAPPGVCCAWPATIGSSPRSGAAATRPSRSPSSATASGILAFCRHMLGSREEAEDAVQHTFAAAYRDLQRGGDREIVLKPWLFTIARNRCLSVLRARHELPQDHTEVATAGLAEQVEQRAELRELAGRHARAARRAARGAAAGRGRRPRAGGHRIRARLRGGPREGARLPGAVGADRPPRGARAALRARSASSSPSCAEARCDAPSCGSTCANARGAASSARR